MENVRALVIALLVMATAAFAQEAKQPEQKAPARIEVAPTEALKIRDAQLRIAQLQQQLQQAQMAFQDAVRSAYATAKVDQAKYQIDDQTWTFMATQQPTATASSPPKEIEPVKTAKKNTPNASKTPTER